MIITMNDSAFRLFGKIQHYSWGGYSFIPTLIGLRPEPGLAYAEYWMGAHEKAPSELLHNNGTTISLNELISEHPEKTLGACIAQKYGRLPFLLKVLDVREMLSIQVHPTKSEAEVGFAQENERGIPLDAPQRNYKDDNHKPELQLALSDFWLLHGFQPKDQLRHVLHQTPEFTILEDIFTNQGYYGLYKHTMEMPIKSVNALLNSLAERILHKYDSGDLAESSPDYWAARAIKGKQLEDYDRGIFSIYFFNLIRLKPGQAIFQDAGIPHAALRGQAIEIMANSDNVIRGGLTPKHIDVPQLLKLITFEGFTPEIVESRQRDNPYEAFYESPSPDFRLSRIQLTTGDVYSNTTGSTEILLLLSGEITFAINDQEMPLKKGECVIVFVRKRYRIRAMSELAVLFKAFIPDI